MVVDESLSSSKYVHLWRNPLLLLSCSINAWIKKIPVQLRWGQGFVWTAFLDHAAFSTNRKRSLRSRPQKMFFGRVNFFGVISYIKSFGCGNRLFESRIEMCKSWKVDKETEWSGGWWCIWHGFYLRVQDFNLFFWNSQLSPSELNFRLFSSKVKVEVICTYLSNVDNFRDGWLYQKQMIFSFSENHTTIFFVKFHAHKALLKVQNLQYKLLDWKWHPPPFPFKLFQRFIRFGTVTRNS